MTINIQLRLKKYGRVYKLIDKLSVIEFKVCNMN